MGLIKSIDFANNERYSKTNNFDIRDGGGSRLKQIAMHEIATAEYDKMADFCEVLTCRNGIEMLVGLYRNAGAFFA